MDKNFLFFGGKHISDTRNKFSVKIQNRIFELSGLAPNWLPGTVNEWRCAPRAWRDGERFVTLYNASKRFELIR